MTIRYTPRHSLPYPEGSDSVEPASRDFKDLAVNVDAALTTVQTIADGKVDAVALPVGTATNLATVTKPGIYSYWGSSLGTPTSLSGMLIVTNLGTETTAVQVVHEHGTSARSWSRFRASAGWSDWRQIDGIDRAHLGVINAGIDLDAYTTPGVYGYWSSATNVPSPLSGMLLVSNLGSTTTVTQVAVEYGSGANMWQRFRGSVSWSPWKRIGGPQDTTPQTTPTALKTAPVALSASSSTATEAVASGAVRFPFKVNAPIARWRLHVRNYNDRMGTAYNSGASFTGLWVGQHAGNGAFSASPTQVSGPFTLPSDGSEVVTPWSSAPLGDDVERLISLGWTGANGPNTQSPAGAYRSTSSTAGPQAASTGFTQSAWVPFSWWIEVQTYADTPLVAMWGDSITTGTGNDLILHDSPLSQYARTIGAIPVHYSFPGTGMSAWTAGGTHQWTRWAHLSPVDAVIHFMGQNDLGGATTLAAMQQRFNDTIGHLKAHVSPNVYLATLTPHAGKTEAQHAVRRAYNTWLGTLPAGALDVFDFSAAVGNAGDTALQPVYDSGDGLHLNTAGSTALAAAVARPVVTPRIAA